MMMALWHDCLILWKVAEKFDLRIISIEDLIKYRLRHESLVSKDLQIKLPTKYGDFQLHGFTQENTGEFHFALTMGNGVKRMPYLLEFTPLV